jgi:hypothetical protein
LKFSPAKLPNALNLTYRDCWSSSAGNGNH